MSRRSGQLYSGFSESTSGSPVVLKSDSGRSRVPRLVFIEPAARVEPLATINPSFMQLTGGIAAAVRGDFHGVRRALSSSAAQAIFAPISE